MPPTRDVGEPLEAKIISELGKEFNVDEVYGTESSFIGSLKSADEFQPVEIPPNGPRNFDEKMLEVCISSIFFMYTYSCWPLRVFIYYT